MKEDLRVSVWLTDEHVTNFSLESLYILKRIADEKKSSLQQKSFFILNYIFRTHGKRHSWKIEILNWLQKYEIEI